MKETIYTIPISEVFEPRDGCPICRLRDALEQRAVAYILGAAMMEPDVREETNRLGFCAGHYQMMLERRSRLQMGLTLQTRLATLLQELDRPPVKQKKAGPAGEGCYICGQIEWAMSRMYANLYQLYGAQEEFRVLFSEQPFFCYPHYKALVAGSGAVAKRVQGQFVDEARRLCRGQLQALYDDVTKFCNMFDYRNNGRQDWGNARDAIERGVGFVTGRTADGGKEEGRK